MLCYPDRYNIKADYNKNIGNYPLKFFNKTSLIVLQGLTVRPEWQGQGLAKEMFYFAATIGMEKGRTDILARVRENNECGKATFIKAGFVNYLAGSTKYREASYDYFYADAYELWDKIRQSRMRLYQPKRHLIITA